MKTKIITTSILVLVVGTTFLISDYTKEKDSTDTIVKTIESQKEDKYCGNINSQIISPDKTMLFIKTGYCPEIVISVPAIIDLEVTKSDLAFLLGVEPRQVILIIEEGRIITFYIESLSLL